MSSPPFARRFAARAARALLPPGLAALAALAALAPREARADDPLGAENSQKKAQDGLILDVNGGIPKLGLAGVNVVGDLALGYQGSGKDISGGVSLAAGLDAYDRVEGLAASDTRRLKFNLDAWLAGASGATRVEFRPSLAVVDYATKGIDLGADRSIFQENSLMLRLHAILGLRHQPRDTLALGLWLGLGLQAEGYESARLSESSQGSWRLGGGLSGSFSGVGSLRGRGYWAVVPDTVSVRGMVDTSIFHITHADGTLQLGTRAAPGGGTSVFLADDTLHTNRATQIDLTSRLFVDLDVLSFGGFVPGLHLGLDAFHVSATEQPSSTSVVPLAGVGLRREGF